MRKHFYSIEVEGERLGDVEEVLAKVESQAAPLVQELDESCWLDIQGRLDLSYFVALTWLRTPFWRDRLAAMVHQTGVAMLVETYKHPEAYRRFLRSTGQEMSDEEAEENRAALLAFLEAGNFDIVPPSNLLIRYFLDAAWPCSWIIYMLDWTVTRPPAGSEFVLADSPVVQYDPAAPDAPGLLSSSEAHTFLPLGPTVGLHMTANRDVRSYFTENEKRLREMEPDEVMKEITEIDVRGCEAEYTDGFVQQLNLLSYATAQRYVYGSQKAVSNVRTFAKKNPTDVGALTPGAGQLYIVDQAQRLTRAVPLGRR